MKKKENSDQSKVPSVQIAGLPDMNSRCPPPPPSREPYDAKRLREQTKRIQEQNYEKGTKQ